MVQFASRSMRSWVPSKRLDEPPGMTPDRHIFVDCGSSWYAIRDRLPRLTKQDVIRLRYSENEINALRAQE